MVIDIDSFIGEVHSDRKPGAFTVIPGSSAITRSLPCAPIPERCIHPNRKGKANAQRGASRSSIDAHPGTSRGAHRHDVIRADSGFENHKQFKTLDRQGVESRSALSNQRRSGH